MRICSSDNTVSVAELWGDISEYTDYYHCVLWIYVWWEMWYGGRLFVRAANGYLLWKCTWVLCFDLFVHRRSEERRVGKGVSLEV